MTLFVVVGHMVLNGSGNVFLGVDLLGSNDRSLKSGVSREL